MRAATKCSPVFILCAALAACGGGGGDGGANVAPVQPAEITSSNAKTVTSAVMVAALEGGDLSAFAVPGAAFSSSGASTKSARLYAKVSEIQGAQTTSLFKQSQAGYMQAAFGPEIIQCDVSGSVTLSGDVANSQTLSAGDTFTFNFADCNDGGSIVDGVLSLTITAFSGDFGSGMYSLGVSLRLTSFRVIENGETTTAHGDISVSVSTLSSPNLSASVTSSSLQIVTGGESHALSDFSVAQTVHETTGEYTIDASGRIETTELDGAVTFETVEPLAGMGSAHPSRGEMLIEGAGSTLRVIVLDSVFVRLELDANGDGTVDEIIDSTWDELT